MALLAIAVGSCVSFRLALADGDSEEDYDIGWTTSRASRADVAFMLLSVLMMVARSVHVYLATIRRCANGGSSEKFVNGMIFSDMLKPMKGRIFRYDLDTRQHVAIHNPEDF